MPTWPQLEAQDGPTSEKWLPTIPMSLSESASEDDLHFVAVLDRLGFEFEGHAVDVWKFRLTC